MTSDTTLDQVTPLLGHAYKEWKEWEGKKGDYKDEFFKLADEALNREGLAIKLFDVPASSETQARQRAERHNPGWKIDEARESRVKPGWYEVILGEDPACKPFTHIHDGIKYHRRVSAGAVLIDDEWLQEEDPALYAEVTYELPWGERIAIPVEHLPKPVLGKLTRYLYTGAPRMALSAPREIKEREDV